MALLQDSLNQLYSMLGTAPATVDEHQKQIAEIQRISAQVENIRSQDAKEKKNEPMAFVFLGTVLMALGGVAMLPLIPGTENLMGFLDRVVYLGVGIAAAAGAGFYTLSRMNRNPLRDVKEKIDNLLNKITSPFKKKKGDPIFSGKLEISLPNTSKSVGYSRSKRDRIIFGVASGIAERLGIGAGIVRLLFVLGTLFSGGAIIIAYFILAMVLPQTPNQREF